jgi:subtilisin family serine protease
MDLVQKPPLTRHIWSKIMEIISFNKFLKLNCLLVAAILALGAITPVLAAQPDNDRYIVSFLDVNKGKAGLRAAGARIELDLSQHEAAAVHIPSRALAGLRRNPNIEYIEPDALRYPMAQTTPWGIPAVQADLVSDADAANRTVCIIDSGYANGHEDLRVLSAADTSPDSDTGNPLVDECHHGSHVAGTISALTNGVGVLGVLPAGNIDLHIVKVFGDDCVWAYSSSLIAALDACQTDGNANIVSMSLGGGVKSRTEERAFNEANNAGVLSIAAAGNDGNRTKSYPASYSSVVSVAAVDSALVVADFSQQNDQVELSGPGVAVRSTVKEGAGFEESLTVGGTTFEATGMEFSPPGSATGGLFNCQAVDGLGSPGDCAGALGKVCLIQRGTLSFADKVAECADQGGVAAVIYNNTAALFSGTLGAEGAIPAVGVSGDDGAILIDLTGQTTTVTTDVGNYAYFDGTSMATPHVSGVAALVWSQGPGCSNDAIRSVLDASAKDLGAAGRDTTYGFGLVQAAEAVIALGTDCGGSGGGGSCDLSPVGASCSVDGDCCSSTCKGKPGSKTCK